MASTKKHALNPLPRTVRATAPWPARDGVRFIARPSRAMAALLGLFAVGGLGFTMMAARKAGEVPWGMAALLVAMPLAVAACHLLWRQWLDVTADALTYRGRLGGLTLRRRRLRRDGGPVRAVAVRNDDRVRVQPPPPSSDWRAEVRIGTAPAVFLGSGLTGTSAAHLAAAVEMAAAGAPPSSFGHETAPEVDLDEGESPSPTPRGWAAVGEGGLMIVLAAFWNGIWITLLAVAWHRGHGPSATLAMVPFAAFGLVLLLAGVGGLAMARDGLRDLRRRRAGGLQVG